MSFEPEHAGAILLYLACLALTMAGASYLFYKFRTNPFSYVLGLAVFGSVVLVLAVKLAPEKFEILNLASYGVFIGGPLVLLAAHFIARSGKLIASAQFYLLLALLVMAIGVDAFVVEPHWLQTTYMTVKTKKLTRSIKIAVISDIQIDQAGDYERGVLKKVMDEKPDLILMPGDYVQCLTLPKQLAQIAKYRGLIQEVGGLPAPLGTFAVRGNVDMEDWPTIFSLPCL